MTDYRHMSPTDGSPRIIVHPSCSAGVQAAMAEHCPHLDLNFVDTESGVLGALKGGQVLVTHRVGWRNSYLVPSLVWVQSQGSGQEGFPIEQFRRRGMIFTTGRGLHLSVAEHAIGLLLALTRDTRRAYRSMDLQRWERYVPNELAGRTVAIVGLGSIGECIAVRLKGWEVDLIGVTRSPASYSGVVPEVHPLESLPEVAAAASVLFVAISSSPETRSIVSAEVLDALGSGWVVNIARGDVVDETALIDRLQDGRLGGAGLDVFESEPLAPESPLWDLPNVICTPHMAGEGEGHSQRFVRLFLDNLDAFVGIGPWHNRVC